MTRIGIEITEVRVAGAASRPEAFHLVTDGHKDTTVVVVGEACAPGAAGERLVAAARKAFKTFAPYTDEPLNLLTLVHQALAGKHGDDGLTAVCVTFDPRSLRVRWASVGHALPMVLETAAPVEAVVPGAEVLGGTAELVGCTGELRLATGEGLVFRADGLSDARRQAALRGLRGLPAGEGEPAVRGGEGDLGLVVLRATVPPRFESRSGPTRERTAAGAIPAR